MTQPATSKLGDLNAVRVVGSIRSAHFRGVPGQKIEQLLPEQIAKLATVTCRQLGRNRWEAKLSTGRWHALQIETKGTK